MKKTEKVFDIFPWRSKEKKNNAYILIILVLLLVVEWVIALVIFLCLQISILILLLPLCEIIKTMKQSFSIYQTSLLAFGCHRPPLPPSHQLCHSLL